MLMTFQAEGISPLASHMLFCVPELSVKCLVNHRPEDEGEAQLLTFGFADAMKSSNLKVFEIMNSLQSSI